MNNTIQVSDLFTGVYDHDRRLNEQAIFIERLKKINGVEEEINFLQEFQDSRIASILSFESVKDRLLEKKVTLT